jgi:parallel beta-helix repeat protein
MLQLKRKGHAHYLTVLLVGILIIGITGGVTAVNDTAEAVPEIVLQVSPVLGTTSDDPSELISDDTDEVGDAGYPDGESPALPDQNSEPVPDGTDPSDPDQGILPADDGSGEADSPDPEEPADMTWELHSDDDISPAIPPEPVPLVAPVDDTNTTMVSQESVPLVAPVDDSNTTMQNQEPAPLLTPLDDNNSTTVNQEPAPLLTPLGDTNTTMLNQEPAPLLTTVNGNGTMTILPDCAIISPGGNQTLVAGNGTPDMVVPGTNATILDSNLLSIGSQQNLTLINNNATPLLDAGCAGNLTGPEFNLSWTEGLTDPPLNATNLQGSPGSQYWEINGTTGSGYYPLDLIGLVTNSVYGIWIHDVSDIVLDGLGQTLQYTGAANEDATGVVIDGATCNIQIKNLTILGWDTGISITGADNVYVTDNTVITGNKNFGGTTGSGIVVKDSTNVYIVSDLSAGSVSVTNNGRDGISYSNVTGGGINNTRVSDNGNNGVNLTWSQWITGDNVTATRNGNGMLLDNASHNTITGSNASMNRNSGIKLLSSDYNNLTGNTVNRNYGSIGENGGNGYGIYLYASDYNTLFRNNASGNFGGSTYRVGFSISTIIDISQGEVSDSTSIQNASLGGSGYGICLDSSNFNNLTGNTAGGNFGGSSDFDARMTYEVHLSGDAQYNGNYTFTDGLNGGNGYGISVTGSSGNNLTGNTASGNFGGLNGIFNFTYSLDQSADATSDIDITLANISSGGSGYGIYLDGSSGNDLFDNSVTGNYGDETNVTRMHGMETRVNGADCTVGITNGAGGTLSANISFLNVNSGNSGYGIYLYGSDGNNLSGNTAGENYGGLINGTSPDCEVAITNAEGADSTTNVSLFNVDTGNAGYGIYLSGSDNNNLSENYAVDNYGGSGINGGNGGNGYGISLLQSDYNILSGNYAGNSYGGNGGNGGNAYGISLLQSDYNNLSGNSASNNCNGIGTIVENCGNGYGISLMQSDYNNLSRNLILYNYGVNAYALYLDGSNYNNIAGNSAQNSHGYRGSNGGSSGNGYGIYLNGSNYNNISWNFAFRNYGTFGLNGYGISLLLSDYNILSGNYISNNHGGNGGNSYGISLLQSDYNTLAGNTVNENFELQQIVSGGNGYGISLLQSDYNNLTGNSAYDNHGGNGNTSSIGENGGNGYGIYLNGSDYNNLAGNSAYGNYGGNGSIGGNGGSGYGISLNGSNYNTLAGNDAYDNHGGNGGSGYGISLNGSNYNNLAGNSAKYNYGGTGLFSTGSGHGIYLTQSSYNNLTGNNARWNTYSGIVIQHSNSNNLTGNEASGNEQYGFHIQYSSDNTLTGNNASGNREYGYYIEGLLGVGEISDHNNLTGNNATGSYIGFYLADTNWTTFDNNTATGNEIGFHLRRSANNILSGNNASYNEANGIEMVTSISNTIVDTIISNNGWPVLAEGPLGKSYQGGLYLYETGDTIVTGNRITDNNGVGITVTDSEGNNTIYNNYFSNIQNAVVTSTLETPAPGPAPVITDYWYISPVAGANIIGGPYIGGNYWGTPDNTGWSQTHPDIGNGFTIPFDTNGDGFNVDQHPLTLNPPVPPEYPGPYTMPVHPTLGWDAAFTSASIPSAVCACSSTSVTVTVNNTGTTGWLQDDVELGAYNDAAKLFSPVLVPLEPDTFVSPGHTYTFSFTLITPCSPGTYNVEYRLVKNNGEWFGDILSIVIDVNDCGQVSTVKTGKLVQTSRTSPAYSASDLIAQKGTGLIISPADSRPTGGTGFSSMQAQALEEYAAKVKTPEVSRVLSGAFTKGILTSVCGAVV